MQCYQRLMFYVCTKFIFFKESSERFCLMNFRPWFKYWNFWSKISVSFYVKIGHFITLGWFLSFDIFLQPLIPKRQLMICIKSRIFHQFQWIEQCYLKSLTTREVGIHLDLIHFLLLLGWGWLGGGSRKHTYLLPAATFLLDPLLWLHLLWPQGSVWCRPADGTCSWTAGPPSPYRPGPQGHHTGHPSQIISRTHLKVKLPLHLSVSPHNISMFPHICICEIIGSLIWSYAMFSEVDVLCVHEVHFL